MNDNSSTPAKRGEPQPDPVLDDSADAEEPAFAWMTGTGPGSTSAARGSSSSGEASDAESPPVPQPESRADRRAAEAAVDPSGAPGTPGSPEHSSASGPDSPPEHASAPGPARHGSAPFKEPLPTSALQVRPPQEEIERRNAQRESAANAKPVVPRVMQILLAVFYPVILLVLAVRAVTSPLFLWAEYNRPGFPGDGYGFSTDDRMTYGSYAIDYLSNWSGPRYLGELVSRNSEKLFKDGEVSHMADVKSVILSAFGAGTVLILISVVAIAYLRRRSAGGVRRGLFAGSIITLVVILALGALAVLGWQEFFTEFHRIFFANGTWTFSLNDTLIRLFPGQFWVDAGIAIGGLVFLAAVLTLILTWPTRRRRGLASGPTGPAAGQE